MSSIVSICEFDVFTVGENRGSRYGYCVECWRSEVVCSDDKLLTYLITTHSITHNDLRALFAQHFVRVYVHHNTQSLEVCVTCGCAPVL